jgi:hypothetical protein
MDELERLLAGSHQFSETLVGLLDSADGFADGPRAKAAAAAAELSFEHAHAMRILLEVGTPNSAAVLLRSQYEALLRAAWLMYAASEAHLDKLSTTLTTESGAKAKNAKGAEDMLKDLEALLVASPTLRGLVLPLREIRDVSWAAMNSFVHGGLHPLARTREGFPLKLAADLLRNSNGMLHMSARLLARLTPSADVVARVETAFKRFEDSLPVVTGPGRLRRALELVRR